MDSGSCLAFLHCATLQRHRPGGIDNGLACPVAILGIADANQTCLAQTLVQPVGEVAGDLIGPVAPFPGINEGLILVGQCRLLAQREMDTLRVQPDLLVQRQSAAVLSGPAGRENNLCLRGEDGQLCPQLSKKWRAALVRLLAKQPEDRFPNLDAFVAAVADPTT